MSDKYQNKYRTQSVRLQNWDYGYNACYFVTICTKDKGHYFGEIVVQTPKLDGGMPVETPNLGVSTAIPKLGISTTVQTPNLGVPTMQLSTIGKIARNFWHEIPNHFPFVELDEFVVMPNHIHGIIIINKNGDDNTVQMSGCANVETPKCANVETPKLGVSTTATTNATTKIGGKNPKWNPGNLGVIINQYKRICTINARKTDANFAWQPRFYDHIIRNDESFTRIKEYIMTNPQKWNDDRFND